MCLPKILLYLSQNYCFIPGLFCSVKRLLKMCQNKSFLTGNITLIAFLKKFTLKNMIIHSISQYPGFLSYKMEGLGLPWWRSGWESACQCRAHRFEPWSGKFPHAAEQLGPWATTTEPARLEPVLRNKRGRDSERPAHHDEEWPPLAATRESPRPETKTQHSQK